MGLVKKLLAPAPEVPRKNLQQLGQKITDRIGVKPGVDDPEYWGFDKILTDEEVDLANCMKVRVGYTFEQIKKFKAAPADDKALEDLLFQMSVKGILEYNKENEDGKNPQHEKRWFLPQYVPGSAEFFNMNEEQLNEHPESGVFFEKMTRLPLEKITPFVPEGGAGIGMHVIPVEKEVNMHEDAMSLEHISYWMDKYDGKYAASPCSCRLSRRTYDEGTPDDPHDWCIAMGDMADYVVETHKGGRYISKEEAYDIMQLAEKKGFVHQITNIDGENKIFAICNCEIKVCYALRTSQLFNTPNMSASAYRAEVDKEKCVACGQCVEICPVGAPSLGQKLCTEDGYIQYPKHELPDEVAWDESKWDWDYRDTARIQTYETGTAPCKAACPAHIGIQGYLQLAKEGRYDEALALIKKDNPFPAVCGHICNKACEAECTRGNVDEALSIDEVKKFLAMRDINSETRYIPEKIVGATDPTYFEDRKIAIIGGGPAGLSCAYYLALAGYKPTIFEKHEKAGGMLVYGIPSFKLEKDVVEAEIDVLRELGVEIKTGVNVGEDVSLQELRDQGYKAFYIGIGCQGGRGLGVDGEDAEGVLNAVNFLGTVADNHDYKVEGKSVVIGGGNVAIDVARTAGRCGSTQVDMFCLESREQMPAADDECAEAEEEGTTIHNGWGPKEILVDENGHTKGVVFKKCLSVFDENHRFNPQYDEDDTYTIEADNVYLSVGQSIEWGKLLEGSKVRLGRGNGVIADPVTYQTDEPDIFAGGDVYTGPNFAITAIAAGRHGAESIRRFIEPHGTLTIARDKREIIPLDKTNIVLGEYDKAPRQQHTFNPDVPKLTGFNDPVNVFTEEQVKIETNRCLKCGATEVDENHCIGCGLCTNVCYFDAIHLERTHPLATRMTTSEDKLKKIAPYAIKRLRKIKKAEKAAEKASK